MGLKGLFAALVLSCSALIAVPSSALADSPGCSLSNHCYSILRTGDSNGSLYAGMYGTWNRAAMSAGCTSSDHRWMNSEMWFDPIEGGWVETGHTAGWLQPAGSCDYFAYAAWMKQDGTGYTERSFAELNHDDSVTDEFQISRSATTDVYYVYWNGNRITTANVQFWNSRRMDMGGEVATAYATSHTFNMQGNAFTASGTQVSMPTPQQEIVDDPPLYGDRPANSTWTWRVRP